VFHGLAGGFLAELGFVLVNDPSRRMNRFGASLAINTMLTELRMTLPGILSRVTLHDLHCIEREEFGAETRACMRGTARWNVSCVPHRCGNLHRVLSAIA
jgi:hypothetical protein